MNAVVTFTELNTIVADARRTPTSRAVDLASRRQRAEGVGQASARITAALRTVKTVAELAEFNAFVADTRKAPASGAILVEHGASFLQNVLLTECGFLHSHAANCYS